MQRISISEIAQQCASTRLVEKFRGDELIYAESLADGRTWSRATGESTEAFENRIMIDLQKTGAIYAERLSHADK